MFVHCTCMYVDHVTRKYGNAVVVFDRYEDGPSTKDATHLQQTRASVSPNVNFSEDMVQKVRIPHQSGQQTFHLSAWQKAPRHRLYHSYGQR